MKIQILTLFPRMLRGLLSESIVGRARKAGIVDISLVDLRRFGLGRHRIVDDRPYGGGPGMVLRPDVVVAAMERCRRPGAWTVLLDPKGRRLDQKVCRRLARKRDLLLVCGHYRGFDERIRKYADEEISVGDFVLSGGEPAAALVVDAVVRLLPGAVGRRDSVTTDSFWRRRLESPVYTRPAEFRGDRVPPVLLSGDHAAIRRWRSRESLRLTAARRPDLL